MDNKNEIKDTKRLPNTIVASFIVDEELHRRLKIYAASTGRKIKDVVNDALVEYLEKSEQ